MLCIIHKSINSVAADENHVQAQEIHLSVLLTELQMVILLTLKCGLRWLDGPSLVN